MRPSSFSPLREGTKGSLLDRVQDRLAAFLNPLSRAVSELALRVTLLEEEEGGAGTVTNVTGTSPIAVATGTTTPVVSHDDAAVTPGTYPNANVTVDAKGHVAAADTTLYPSWGIDAPPASPNADDIEFAGNADPFNGWSDASSSLTTQEAGDPDPAVTVASTKYRFSSTARPGWCVLQLGQNGAGTGIFDRQKAHTFGTDECAVFHLDVAMANAPPTADAPGIALNLGQTSGGSLDLNNRVDVYLNPSGRQITSTRYVGGVTTANFAAISYGGANMPRRISRVAVWKKSTTYRFYVRGGDTGWVYLGGATAAITPDRVALTLFGAGATIPGSPIVAFQYLRFLPSFPT